MLRVVCWDFDGTLAWSAHLWSASVWTALNETDMKHGVPLDAVRGQMATGFPWHTPERDYRAMTGEKWWAFMEEHFYGAYLRLGVAPPIARTASGKVRSIIKRTENYHLYPDAAATLEAVRNKGCRNVLLSNNYPDLAEVVGRLGIYGLFDTVVISGAAGYDKPRAEIFDMVKASYPAGTSFFMVGDNRKADIAGGNEAGMTTVLVHSGEDSRADYSFDCLWRVCEIL